MTPTEASSRTSERGRSKDAARPVPYQPAPTYPWGRELPLVGRRAQVETARMALDRAYEGHGFTLFVTGESGIGKTRLTRELVVEAEARGFSIAIGSAFAVESRSPYGVLANALIPLLNAMDPASLAVLTRGMEGDLQALLPGLVFPRAAIERSSDADLRTRLHWNFVQFIKRLTARRPLLLVYDNAQWCDPSSLELAHFVARQISDTSLLLVLTYGTDKLEAVPQLRSIERSLVGMREAVVLQLLPLLAADITTLMQKTFSLDRQSAEAIAAALHRHTGGNAFFLEETLKLLLHTEGIRKAEEHWIAADLSDLALPATVRDVVAERLASLSEASRRIAEIAAVVGTRAGLELLETVAGIESAVFANAIDELCARRILIEYRGGRATHYEFAHPIVQAAVLGMLTTPRTRALHARVADALIGQHGVNAILYAAEIAVHLGRSGSLGTRERDLAFLSRAGRDALAKRADREAAQWLAEALQIADQRDAAVIPADLRDLVEALATAKARIGESTEELLARAYELAEMDNDGAARSRLLRQMGLRAVASGRSADALAHFERAEAAARDAGRLDLATRVRVTAGMTLLALGRADEGRRAIADIVPTAEQLGDHALLGRVHRALLQLHVVKGQADRAREHGQQALTHAAACGDKTVAWAAHWAMSILAGFTGDSVGVVQHRQEATRLAEQLRSPILQISTAELAIEYASAVGDWNEGLALAERAIPIARAVASRTVLPRLLVWTGLIVLARDDIERARDLFDEAWRLARAQSLGEADALQLADGGNVHNIILAHTGQAALQLALGNWARAVELCDRALALTDKFGYVVWAIHRLLPILAEALLWLQEFARAEAVARRLREQSGALGHRLGLAAATAIDALVLRLKHQSPDAAARLLASAAELEAVPFVFHAARLRRNAAQLLASYGDTAGAIRELRHAHDTFVRLGAEFELRGTRSQLRSLGVRLPPRNASSGSGALTGRELEIARCVARRLSNKEIARTLDISARTVSTHLSNIFEKLGVDSRGALADLVRESPHLAERVT